jgi:hypothetical protein
MNNLKSLKYANENKSKNKEGWVLDFDYLSNIQKQVEDTHVSVDMETIETILLVANGEGDLL